MPLLRNLAGGLRALFRKRQSERELDDELRGYLEAAAREKMRAGLSREAALRAARVEMGSAEAVKEEVRSAGWESLLESMGQDVRYGARRLRQSPGFTLVCVLTLALGIGANTAIFTLVDAVLLKPLPVANPGQLYRLGDNDNCCIMTGDTQNGGSYVLYSYPLYETLRAHSAEFSELAAFQPFLSDLSVRRSGAAEAAEPYSGEFVSGNYFAMLGVAARAGRTLTPADDAPGAPPAAVMSYHAWQQRFGLDPSVVGSAFAINGVPYTVAGVAPPGFYGETLRSDPPDFWLPLGTEPALNRGDARLRRSHLFWLYLIGRLRPGAQAARAQSHLTVELQQWLWRTGWDSATPQQRGDRALVDQARREIARQHIRLTPARSGVDEMQAGYAAGLRLLMAVAALVLLIACANLANLLLARGTAGQLQTSIRIALGASRQRLTRQTLTENVLLAALGGAAGLFLAYNGARAVLLLAFRGAHYVPISPDPSPAVLGFTVALSLVTAMVFGAAPAWIAARSDPADALRGAGRSTRGRSSLPRRSLVVLQVALSLVLLIGAGLLTESLRNLEHQQFGFVTSGRLIVHLDPGEAGYTPQRLAGLYPELEERLRQIPGVWSASLSSYSPLEHQNWNQDVYIEGRAPARSSGPSQNSSLDRVGPRYFETIGTPLLRGRDLGGDSAGSYREAVVNRAFTRKFFPHEDALGRHFGLDDASHSGDYEIVGIVEDAKYTQADQPPYPTAFLPLMLTPSSAAGIRDIEMHVAGKPESLEPAVRKAIAGIDPNLTVLDVTTFSEQVARNFNQQRLIARLTALFGLVALVLACVGLYGVTAYSVARRTNEIGVRMTLGAGGKNVLGLVLRGALGQVVLGLAIGVPLALAGGRVLAGQLFGVRSYDPAILGGTSLLLAACALAAALIPARRATKVDPMVALRHE